jgi:hypothetical protein
LDGFTQTHLISQNAILSEKESKTWNFLTWIMCVSSIFILPYFISKVLNKYKYKRAGMPCPLPNQPPNQTDSIKQNFRSSVVLEKDLWLCQMAGTSYNFWCTCINYWPIRVTTFLILALHTSLKMEATYLL